MMRRRTSMKKLWYLLINQNQNFSAENKPIKVFVVMLSVGKQERKQGNN